MEVTVYEDNLSKEGTFIIDTYINFFIKNLQNRYELDGKTYLEGASAARTFLDNLTPQLFVNPDFDRWIKDEDLESLHKQIKENGMKLCPLNFYTLCQYILTIIKEQYLILLKPTIADTLSELDEVESITFKTKKGKTITTSNTELLKMVMANIKEGEANTYERAKFVKIDEIADNILIQSSFTYYVALFLKEYFKDYPRRNNCCMVSALEQKLILYMLSFFELAPYPLTDSRFRQFISYYNKHRSRVTLSILPEVGIVPMEFIKYKDWKGKSIKLDQLDPLKEGETVRF